MLFDNAGAVRLSPGDWYVTAVNVSGGPVSYCIKATEYPVYGTNLNVRATVSGNSFCLTWDSLIGVHYVVQGKTNLVTPGWDNLSPTITATNTQTTWCIPLPSPYSYFRVIEGLALSTNAPAMGLPSLSVTATNGGFLLQWSGLTNQQYQVQWASDLVPVINWNTFTNIISSTTSQFSFLDDGTQAPLGTLRFYRLRLYP